MDICYTSLVSESAAEEDAQQQPTSIQSNIWSNRLHLLQLEQISILILNRIRSTVDRIGASLFL